MYFSENRNIEGDKMFEMEVFPYYSIGQCKFKDQCFRVHLTEDCKIVHTKGKEKCVLMITYHLKFLIQNIQYPKKYWMKKHFMNAGTVAKILRI